jgi:hypothetical protein
MQQPTLFDQVPAVPYEAQRENRTPEILRADAIKALKEHKQVTAVTHQGDKFRLFYRESDDLVCHFAKGSRTRGHRFEHMWGDVKRLLIPYNDERETAWKEVQKFRKQAERATFTNPFIRDCLKVPATREQWEADGRKDAYQYNLTTGCKITGDLVSIEAICRHYNEDPEQIRELIRARENFSTSRFDWNGYDGRIEFKRDENGDFRGYLSKEYRGTGNGYYYLLINDEYFIGYDID